MNIRDVFLTFIFAVFCACKSDAMTVRYCRGVYNDRVQSLSNVIFSGENIDKGDIGSSIDFLDNRETSPLIDSRYGRTASMKSSLDEARVMNDKSLVAFAENCRDYSNDKDPKKQIAVNFLLHGVIEKCKGLFKLRRIGSSAGATIFPDVYKFESTFDKAFAQMLFDKLGE